ncbi:hypothetical protein BDM02DRAFT_3127276 [Thelephora ganbajun]|uniref:Uncharacterized protein n=1 Tax=Thelephora ganbajun TaxID=370292 RepID=A0ACB6ZMY0_THEGA|nr:hypothetical protein BDM02DRAFT_3127276 [Thelephora ganbajun]
MSFPSRPPSPEEGLTPLDASKLTQMAPVNPNSPNLFAGLSTILESEKRDSTRSPSIAGRVERRRSANKLGVCSTSRTHSRNVSRASSPSTPHRRRSTTSHPPISNKELIQRATTQLEQQKPDEDMSDDKLDYGEETPRESYDHMVKRLEETKSPIQDWDVTDNYGTDTLTQRITVLEALEDSEIKTHQMIKDPGFTDTLFDIDTDGFEEVFKSNIRTKSTDSSNKGKSKYHAELSIPGRAGTVPPGYEGSPLIPEISVGGPCATAGYELIIVPDITKMWSNEDGWNMLLKLCADTAHTVNCFGHNLAVANNRLKYNIAKSHVTHHHLNAITLLTKQMVADSGETDAGVSAIRGALENINNNTKGLKKLEEKLKMDILDIAIDSEKSRSNTDTLVAQVNNMRKVVDTVTKSSSDGVKISQKIGQATDKIISDMTTIKNKVPSIMVTSEGQQVIQLAAPGQEELQKLSSAVHTIKGQLDTIHMENVKMTEIMARKSSVPPTTAPQTQVASSSHQQQQRQTTAPQAVVPPPHPSVGYSTMPPQQQPQQQPDQPQPPKNAYTWNLEPAQLTKGAEFFFDKLNSIPDEVVVWWAKVISWGGWGPIGPQDKPTSCNSAWPVEQKRIWIADAIRRAFQPKSYKSFLLPPSHGPGTKTASVNKYGWNHCVYKGFGPLPTIRKGTPVQICGPPLSDPNELHYEDLHPTSQQATTFEAPSNEEWTKVEGKKRSYAQIATTPGSTGATTANTGNITSPKHPKHNDDENPTNWIIRFRRNDAPVEGSRMSPYTGGKGWFTEPVNCK